MAVTDENIELIRGILKLPGWHAVMAPEIATRMEKVKNSLAVDPKDRDEEFRTYSTDRLGGIVQGMGWTLNIWLPLIKRYDELRALQRAEEAAARDSDAATGHPFAPDATIPS